jgi:hypothetical protein
MFQSNPQTAKYIPTLSIKQFSPKSLYRFFFSEWAQCLPAATTLKEFVSQILPLLRYIGVNLSRDLVLLGKLIRIGKSYFLKEVGQSPHA